MPTRLAILSDLHGNSAATAAVLADIERAGPDAIYCLGDLVGYGAHPNEVIDQIREQDIPTIMGNYDDGVGFDRDDCGCAYTTADERERGHQSLAWTRAVVTAERKAYLRSLPPELRVDHDQFRLRLVHGSPRRMNEYLFADRDARSLARIAEASDCDILLFGHTHLPWERVIAGVQMINTGSVGKPKDGDPQACWVQLDLAPGRIPSVTVHRVAYDVAAMAAAIRAAAGLPDHYAADLETGGQPR